MKLQIHLNFNGNCAEAFKFYEQILGGTMSMSTYGESPMADKIEPAWRDKIMHAALQSGDQLLMGADTPHGAFVGNHGFEVCLATGDKSEAERIFAALSDGATITMPMQQTFWSPAFGMLTDKFGIPWMVNCEHPQQ